MKAAGQMVARVAPGAVGDPSERVAGLVEAPGEAVVATTRQALRRAATDLMGLTALEAPDPILVAEAAPAEIRSHRVGGL